MDIYFDVSIRLSDGQNETSSIYCVTLAFLHSSLGLQIEAHASPGSALQICRH